MNGEPVHGLVHTEVVELILKVSMSTTDCGDPVGAGRGDKALLLPSHSQLSLFIS